jgi:hypothetical protein
MNVRNMERILPRGIDLYRNYLPKIYQPRNKLMAKFRKRVFKKVITRTVRRKVTRSYQYETDKMPLKYPMI